MGAALVLSNLILGALSVYLLRAQDTSYAKLIDDSVPLMNDVRSIGDESALSFRMIIQALVSNDHETIAAAISRAREAMGRADDMRQRIGKEAMLASQASRMAVLNRAAEAYDADAAQLLSRVKPYSTADAEEAAIRRLGAESDRYGDAIQSIADYVQSHAEATSSEYTAISRNRSAFVLGLAGWPLLMAGLLVALTVAVVVVMLFVFRQADAGDGP